jgi:hypothetical protein
MSFKRSEVIGVIVQLLKSRRAGGFQKKMYHHLILLTKLGGQYQGVGAADKVMLACGPNCLLGSRRVKDVQIPP